MVVSAYSLIELPNTKTRLDTVMKLWQKTKHYLVIVEHGTNAGFNVSLLQQNLFYIYEFIGLSFNPVTDNIFFIF